jgi:hypothetical protein
VAAKVTLRPGQRGTKRLVQRYGDRLVCVRYRYDPVKAKRQTTVELVVDEVAWKPRPARDSTPSPPSNATLVGIRIGYNEVALREKVKAAGGYWDPARKLWLLPLRRACALGLNSRLAFP